MMRAAFLHRLENSCQMFGLAAAVSIASYSSGQLAEPANVLAAESGPANLWTLRSEHLVWGMPVATDNRHNIVYPGEATPRPGLSVLVREGFVVGHFDRHKVPAWVSVRWTREDHDNLRDGSFSRPFAEDETLPVYARAGTSYEFSSSDMERGHMARHEDNEAWGRDNSDSGCLMSNIVPQHKDMNGEAWNDLENMHQEIVADASSGIDAVWIISGPVFEHGEPQHTVGNGVGVPEATYKIIGWFDASRTFHARGYMVRQEDRVRDNPTHYLTQVDAIEALTGLDFFPELDDSREAQIESITHTTLWHTEFDSPRPGEDGLATVRISAVLPNPVGDDDQNESVTLRNFGDRPVSLVGWVLRDEADRGWRLLGVLDAGDERTFQRNGQAMALNNGGDTVRLITGDGTVVDLFSYGRAAPGQVLRP